MQVCMRLREVYLCVCVCARACMYVHACSLFSWISLCFWSSVCFVDRDVFLLRTQGSHQFVWQIHFYITLQYLSLAVMQAVHLDNPVPDPRSYPEK